VGKSWLDHPYYFGGFAGSMSGTELVSNLIKQQNGGSGGLIFGYNFNDYWGLESRLHFTALGIRDTDYARQLIGELYPDVVLLPTTRTNQLTIFDVGVQYYPLGNAKWRPYFKSGLGIGRQTFTDSFGNRQSSDLLTMPLGLGMRYWWNERLAIQMDLTDNVIFASGSAKTQNNFAFTVGLTFAFGTGKRQHPVHYWPATPSMGSKW
jgi:outer membrane beta-barrel protein